MKHICMYKIKGWEASKRTCEGTHTTTRTCKHIKQPKLKDLLLHHDAFIEGTKKNIKGGFKQEMKEAYT